MSFQEKQTLAFGGLTYQTTTLDDNGLFCKYRVFGIPAKTERIPLDRITGFCHKKYSGIWDFGGWGVRANRECTCLTTSGSDGVMITIADRDKPLLVGSKQVPAFLSALTQSCKHVATVASNSTSDSQPETANT
mmetsp:Transcript_19050/g.37607  ORF Transcript_19050/g.37607 Transcript_19050/m.37607 type:complete len:134 (-) Transcript_19050:147-548(-)